MTTDSPERLPSDVATGFRERVRRPGTWTTGIFLAVAMLAILPVVAFGFATVRLSSNAVSEQVDTRIQASALASANVVEQQLGRLADIVGAQSEQPRFRNAVQADDHTEMRLTLGRLVELRDDVQLAFVVDPSGILSDVVPATPEAIGRDFSFRDWYQGVSASRATYVSEAYETAATGTPLVYVAAAPIMSESDPDEVIGYIGVGQTLESLQVFVDDFADSQEVSLTIVDQAGTIVSEPGAVPTETVAFDDPSLISAADAGASAVRDTQRRGERHLIAAAPVPSFGWSVTANVSADTALAQVRRITVTVMVIALILSMMVLIAVTALVWLLRRRREAVERQARSEEFLRSIVDNIPSIVIVKHAETLRIERINPAGEEILGASEHLIGRHDGDLLPTEYARASMAAEREILRTGRVEDIALDEISTATGVRQFRTRKIPIEQRGDIPGFLLCICDDITENVAAITALQDAKGEAERANAAKSDFLSRMSHELRTPLNAVIGFGQLLEMDDLTGEQHESVDQVLRGGRHLLGLINEILDLARIETGRLSLSLEPTRIDDVATDALDLVRPLAAEAGIDIPTSVGLDWAHWVFADQQRVKQVLINLLANAIKYNRPGGRVDIECRVADDRLRIGITDTGHGIADDRLAQLFVPFERLGAEGSDVEGTGLGLSLSKRLVEAMGGSIGVDSEIGRGSTFWIEIDRAPDVSKVDAVDSPRGHEMSAIPGGATILYIEDNESNIMLLERLLDFRPGTTLITARTGEEGLALAATCDPDLILLDVNLPGIAGREAVRILRERPDTRYVPIVVLSADATERTIASVIDHGADHYLTKPIDVAELFATVDAELAVSATG